MSTSFHSFSSHSSQNESGMRKWPKNDDFRPEWDWPHPSHSLSFDSFGGHPKPRMTLEWGKTSFSSHFRGITKPSFPSSEKCFNFGTMGIDGQAYDTEWLENDKNDCGMIRMSPNEMNDEGVCYHGDLMNCNKGMRSYPGGCSWWHFYPDETKEDMLVGKERKLHSRTGLLVQWRTEIQRWRWNKSTALSRSGSAGLGLHRLNWNSATL